MKEALIVFGLWLSAVIAGALLGTWATFLLVDAGIKRTEREYAEEIAALESLGKWGV